MKQNLPLNQAILTVEQLDKEYPFVDLLLDAGFKHVFGRQKNKDILIAFLNQIIPDRTIVDLTYNQNEQIPDNIESKASRFDLYCTTDDGSRIIVELQRKEQHDYIHRSLYYSSLPIAEQVRIGNETYMFSHIYIVNILNFTLKETAHREQVLSAFRYKEIEDNTLLTDRITHIFVELPKFKKKLEEIDKENVQDIFYFCLRNLKDLKTIPDSLDTEIAQRIFTASAVAAMTTQEKMYYIDNMNTERDIRNQIQFAADKGREEGLKRGLEEGKKEGIEKATLLMASKLKADGMDIELIIKYSGLTREEIEML